MRGWRGVRWERLAEPSPAQRRGLLGLAAALVAAVIALRWAIDDPYLPVGVFAFLPIAAGALAYRLPGATGVALVVLGLLLHWWLVRAPGWSFAALSFRVIGTIVPGLAVGWMVDAFAKSLRERTRTTERLEAANRELERSNRDLDRFARIASHDLSEPLRVVKGFVALLERRAMDRLGSEEQRYLEAITAATERMQALIDDVLAWSRAGSRPLEVEDVEVGVVLREVEESLAAALAESGGRVEADGLPTVRADAGQVRQLLQNLISNALKFRGDDPPLVRVSAVPEGTGWRFAVRDNGIGMDPERADRAFQMFQRLHPREEYPGTGIGLAICQTVVERHGGRIWIESAPGQGTTIWFTLGAAPDRPGAEAAVFTPPVARRPPAPAARR